jgi:CheY-like chemotaxis protein
VRGGTETILLVEDEPTVSRFVCATLKRYGYTVQVATSGAQALDHWREHLGEIDLLITDIIMPDGISGWELSRQLQAQKPSLRTVFMSGYNSDMTAVKLGAAPGKGGTFLQKPFKPQDLARAVRAALEGNPPATQPSPEPVTAAAVEPH